MKCTQGECSIHFECLSGAFELPIITFLYSLCILSHEYATIIYFHGRFNFAIFADSCSNCKIKKRKKNRSAILTPSPHQISGDQLLPYSWKPSNNAISSMRLHDDWACDSSLICMHHCFLRFKTLQKLMVFGDICEILSLIILLLSVIKGIGSRYKA